MNAAPETAPGARAPWIEGAVLALIVLAILAASGDAVRASYHGYLHVTIGEAVLRDGLTPENPYHAGAALRYYTLYPALGAWIGRAGIGPLWAFAWLNVLAAFLLPPAVDALGRACGLGFAARRATFLAMVLGFNGLGWLGFALGHDFAFGRPPVYALMPMCFDGHAFGWDARLQAFLPKFLNVSSFALALPFALWALGRAFRDASNARPLPILVAGASLGASMALNPLAGGVVAVCMTIALVPRLWTAGRAFRTAWFGAAAIAVGIAVPFLLPAFVRAPSGADLTGDPDLGGSPLANLIGPLLVLAPIGLIGLSRFDASVRWRVASVLAVCAVLVLVGEMPQSNEYKMERMGALVWALPAGACCARWFARGGPARVTVVALALACLPTTVLVPWAYAAYGKRAPALPLVVERGRLAPDPAAEDALPRSILEAEHAADPRAVVVMSHDEPHTRLAGGLVQGNALAPALSHPLFVDLPQIHNERQPDLELRLDLVAGLWQGIEFHPSQGAPRPREQALRELRSVLPDRPLLFLVHDADVEVDRVLRAAGARERSRARGVGLFELDPLASMSREEH